LQTARQIEEKVCANIRGIEDRERPGVSKPVTPVISMTGSELNAANSTVLPEGRWFIGLKTALLPAHR
jgi:hypothetical protein